jgi:hypothetical protein
VGCTPAREVASVLSQLAIGSLLMIITTFVHAACTLAALWALRMMHADRWGLGSRWTRVTLIAALVVMMFLAAILEITIWAATYLVVGAMSALEPALYFSTVTFTTLGYGDVTLNDSWRLMASFEAVNGIILIGWTTALIFAFVRRVASHDEAIAARLDR